MGEGQLSDQDGFERIKEWFQLSNEAGQLSDNYGWMKGIMPHLKIQSHSAAMPHPSVTFRFTVLPDHANGLNNMHGGCTATLFDLCTSMPLHFVSRPGFWQYMGVSRTLNCTYLRPIPVGTTVDIECTLMQVGKKLATVRGEMRAVREGDPDGAKGPLLAVCEHGKVSLEGLPPSKL
ncbi:HotDog domain-containing protein [Xylariales sp. PMI_506]|nr:HotDog domain-containing protein [Xylariales sp. PMI_506]